MSDNDKTVTVGELKRRIAKEKETYEKEISELVDKYESVIETLQNKPKEKDFASEELKQANQRISELEKQAKHRQLRDVAIDKLNETGLPVNDTSLNFVVRGDEDETASAIDNLKTLIDEQNEAYVERYKRGKTPGRMDSDVTVTQKEFDNMSLTEKGKLYRKDEDLYNKLSEGK